MKLVVVAFVLAGCAHEHVVRWEDVDKTHAPPTHEPPTVQEVPPTGDAPPTAPTTETPPTTTTTPPPAATTTTPPAPPPTPTIAPPEKAALISGAPIMIDGKSVDDGAIVDMPQLELACMPDANALVDVVKTRARFDAIAEKLNVAVGRISFVLLERDPKRSITDPPPRLCWNIPTATSLKAPLFREREKAARWIVKRISTSLVDDAGALVTASAEKKYEATANPRVIVDDKGALVAVVLPVRPQS